MIAVRTVLALAFLIFGFAVKAELWWIKSTSVSLDNFSSESDLKNSEGSKVLTFIPNVTNSLGLGFETEYLTISYSFSFGDASRRDLPKSKFQDLRLNFSYEHFDFRLNLQRYEGAYVFAENVRTYYKDYRVRSRNARIHYYSKKNILDFVRDGQALTKFAAQNEGTKYFVSWFAGLNFDRRVLTLPRSLAPEHLSFVNKKGINYSSKFNALTLGPLFGYDLVFFKGGFFFRGKFGIGPGFQIGGRVTQQAEIALNLGLGFFQNHSVSLGVDSYIMDFRDDSKVISNNNLKGGLTYNYAF